MQICELLHWNKDSGGTGTQCRCLSFVHSVWWCLVLGLLDFCSRSGNCRHYHARGLRCSKLELESGNSPLKSSEVCSIAVDGLPSTCVVETCILNVTAFLSILVLFGSFFHVLQLLPIRFTH